MPLVSSPTTNRCRRPFISCCDLPWKWWSLAVICQIHWGWARSLLYWENLSASINTFPSCHLRWGYAQPLNLVCCLRLSEYFLSSLQKTPQAQLLLQQFNYYYHDCMISSVPKNVRNCLRIKPTIKIINCMILNISKLESIQGTREVWLRNLLREEGWMAPPWILHHARI